VTAEVAKQWWDLVKQEYPDSTREGTQLFTFRGDDIPGQIWDNSKFEHLKNKWFYSHFGDTSGTGGIIPLQDENGNLLGQSTSTLSSDAKSSNGGDDATGERNGSNAVDISKLSVALEKMQSMIEENTNQIKALGVAQSEGLRRMQEINESNAGQIKSLAEGQFKLQSFINENANQFIALSNSQFSNQNAVKEVLATNAEQIKTLAQGQKDLAATCKDMMRAITQLSRTPALSSPAPSLNGSTNNHNFLPPPRKIGKRIKGYAYESEDEQRQKKTVVILAPPSPEPADAEQNRTPRKLERK
jgi:hypothetical protein